MNQLDTQEINIPLGKVRPGPYQTRQDFDRTELTGLARSIQADGLINRPLIVAENGHYNLLAGERRWRALCALALSTQPGITLDDAIDRVCDRRFPQWLKEFPLLQKITSTFNLTRETNPHRQRVLSVVENLQRVDLDPIEEAEGFQALFDAGLGWPAVVEYTGKNKSYIEQKLELLSLPDPVKAGIKSRTIPLKAVKDIKTLSSAMQVELVEKMKGRKTKEFAQVINLVKGKGTTDAGKVGGPTPEQQLTDSRKLLAKMWSQLRVDALLLEEAANALLEAGGDQLVAERIAQRAQGIKHGIQLHFKLTGKKADLAHS